MSKPRISSRWANKQKKELTKQSILFVSLSVLTLVIFLVVILPSAVRLFFEVLDNQSVIENETGLPPQPPIIVPLPEHVNQGSFTLSGFAQPDTRITLLLDQQKQSETMVDNEGAFEIELVLHPGNNLITLFSVNNSGVESAQTSFQVEYDNVPPQIKIGSPEEGERFELRENQSIQVQGETKPRSRVFINGRMSIADQEGLFSQRYHLEEGENKIEIKVIDQAGNESQTELTVFFRL